MAFAQHRKWRLLDCFALLISHSSHSWRVNNWESFGRWNNHPSLQSECGRVRHQVRIDSCSYGSQWSCMEIANMRWDVILCISWCQCSLVWCLAQQWVTVLDSQNSLKFELWLLIVHSGAKLSRGMSCVLLECVRFLCGCWRNEVNDLPG